MACVDRSERFENALSKVVGCLSPAMAEVTYREVRVLKAEFARGQRLEDLLREIQTYLATADLTAKEQALAMYNRIGAAIGPEFRTDSTVPPVNR